MGLGDKSIRLRDGVMGLVDKSMELGDGGVGLGDGGMGMGTRGMGLGDRAWGWEVMAPLPDILVLWSPQSRDWFI